MIRRGVPQRVGHAPGELNHYFYESKGLAAIIAPWNFPLAIALGMASAAIVTGNPVIFKPSNITGIIGHHLVQIFLEAGLPAGVFNYVPGKGSVMGDFLVDHPDISLIAFTGSVETGLRIIDRAAKVYPGQLNVKKSSPKWEAKTPSLSTTTLIWMKRYPMCSTRLSPSRARNV